MKKLGLVAALTVAALASHAQADYKPVLKTTFSAFDTTYYDVAAKTALGNKLILIAKKYPSEFAPNYYAAYACTQISYFETDAAKKDTYVDEAENYYSAALQALGRENDETHVLAAIIANARMAVKPQARYQKYGKIFSEQLDSAKALNADNPRIYLERGIAKFYTPKMFGGGRTAAKPYFEKAEMLYAKEAGEDITKPYWGKYANTFFLAQINGSSPEKD